MAASTALATVVGDQKRWSTAAGSLKSSIEQARRTVLWLAVLGAILETLAAQIAHVSQIEEIKTAHATHSALAMAFGYLGAATLAVAAVIRHSGAKREQNSSAAVRCRPFDSRPRPTALRQRSPSRLM